jgi:hypothetical protein
MRHIRVILRRDSNTIHNRTLAEWEIPMLEYLFGEEGQVEVTEDYVQAAGDYPDPKEEFERLKTAYGGDRKSGVPHVQTVFGTGHAGVKTLRKAIEESRAAEIASKQPRSRRRVVTVTDPMLA